MKTETPGQSSPHCSARLQPQSSSRGALSAVPVLIFSTAPLPSAVISAVISAPSDPHSGQGDQESSGMHPELNPASTRCFCWLRVTELLLLWGGCKDSHRAQAGAQISCASKRCHRHWEWMEPFISHNKMPDTFSFKCQEAPGLCTGSPRVAQVWSQSLNPPFLCFFPTSQHSLEFAAWETLWSRLSLCRAPCGVSG